MTEPPDLRTVLETLLAKFNPTITNETKLDLLERLSGV